MQTRLQGFPWSLKTVAAADVSTTSGVNNSLGIEAVLPANFLSTQGVWAKLIFVHDGTAAGRNITSISVQSDETTTPVWARTIKVTNTPTTMTYGGVGGSIVTSYAAEVSALRYVPGRNVVFFNFDQPISGTIKLFKLDFYYQVVGIR